MKIYPYVIMMVIFITCLTACQSASQTMPNGITNETLTLKDLEGHDITVKTHLERIISLTPEVTEILIELGLTDKIIAIDEYSQALFEDNQQLPAFDILYPDAEQIVALHGDIIFATSMSKVSGEDPLNLLREMGVAVAYIPVAETIDQIKENILFISKITGVQAQGQEIIENMEKTIQDYSGIAKTIMTPKTVYFEIGAAPSMYSFGQGVFLHEIIELIGAKNILEHESGWLSITPEIVVSSNPDVIITNVNYIEEPVNEIKMRGGFSEINAVKNDQVYVIDNNASSRANHNIVIAIEAIAKAVYPEEFN